jgi:hypothetical protein
MAETDALSAYALLLALTYLDAPLAELQPIIHAARGHVELGRSQAEARGALALELQRAQQSGQTEPHRLPSLDVVVTRIATLVRHGPDLPTLVRHELSRVEADLRRYRYGDDCGTSAAKRVDYQNLLAAARRHEFDRVRFESVDRGHRNDLERRQFEAEMAALGIDVVYSGEPEKQAPQFRKLQRGIKGVLAEWESDETSQRT